MDYFDIPTLFQGLYGTGQDSPQIGGAGVPSMMGNAPAKTGYEDIPSPKNPEGKGMKVPSVAGKSGDAKSDSEGHDWSKILQAVAGAAMNKHTDFPRPVPVDVGGARQMDPSALMQAYQAMAQRSAQGPSFPMLPLSALLRR